ncbi:hypothetical protein OG562_29280 [Streptomyces sp. NBC_01275]|uniref:hypothetical protein n=1 Tax=Streptomyces sp. NBC_01275 TaxID=2903807 RepID=UPI00224F6BB6|nr:hypothetical protein [Streptomyces sp. NBC_01275]MCX4764991.1 hypothetical protein [Streptomyces sp. NBC_01275]
MYEMRGVIAGEQVLRRAAQDLLPFALRSSPLEQGLSLVPMSNAFFAAVADGGRGHALGFRFLPAALVHRLALWSHAGPAAYVEADYFGGVGEQQAAVWHEGRLTLGPLRVEEEEPFPAEGSPISQALRRLGVVAQAGEDEFSAVRLGRRRSLMGWPTT